MTLKTTLKALLKPALDYRDYRRLPEAARAEDAKDKRGLATEDPGSEAVVREAVNWLYRAQDHSPDNDGGVARHYSLVSGWGHSYPETTGYIVPTLIDWHHRTGEKEALERARRMLDWFVAIQFEEGGFQGGMINAQPKVPVTFNTGQILLGLAAGVAEFGDAYRPAMTKAADWLRDSMDPDGAWRKHATPFAKPGDKAYETHVSWGLLDAHAQAPNSSYGNAALKNVNWALTKQQSNGWFADCCLDKPLTPLTHTIGYVLRGILEAWRFSNDRQLFDAVRKTLDALYAKIDAEGMLPGRFDAQWNPAVSWVCLTGSAQLAHCFLMAYQDSGENRYLDAGQRLNRFVRRAVAIDGPSETRGAVKGAFPVSGRYGEYQYLNWAAKFTIDANLLEMDIASAEGN